MKNSKNFKIIVFACLISLAGLFTFALVSCGPKAKVRDVILITAHSLRPDHLSCYGYEHIKTEAIDNLAKSGTLFENTYTTVPHPLYGYASILSGENGGSVVKRKGDLLGLNLPEVTLPEHLNKAGYNTLAVISDPILAKEKELPGLFSEFADVLTGLSREEMANRANLVTEEALSLLEKNKKKRNPIFLWVEYSLPLFPYTMPDDFEEAKDDFPYDRQVLLLDEEVSRFIQGLKKLDLYKNTLLIFTAVKGEGLNEHNESVPGIFLYDSSMKVPLIIKVPNYSEGNRTSALSSQIDILPTVLDALGIKYDASSLEGMSLMPLIPQKDDKDGVSQKVLDAFKKRSLHIESLIGHYLYGWSPLVGVISEGYKYIELPQSELYDLEKDVHELKNIISRQPEEAKRLKEKLMDYVQKERSELTDIINKGANPKDKIHLIRRFRFPATSLQQVIDLFNKLLEEDPANKFFKFQLARLYMQEKDADKAKEMLISLTETYPDFNSAWEMLGIVYHSQGETAEAIKSYEKALSTNPDMPVALNNLAAIYMMEEIDLDKALEYAKKANELSPDNPRYMDTLAETYLKLGEVDKAKDLLEEALLKTYGTQMGKYFERRLESIEASAPRTDPAIISEPLQDAPDEE